MNDINFFGTTAKMLLRIAILGVSLGTVKLMPVDNQIKLTQACKDNTLLQKYLKEGGDPNARLTNTHNSNSGKYPDNYPLLFCVSDEGAEILLKHGANPNLPLKKAFNYKNINVMRLLLKYGANPNLKLYNNNSLLHQAVSNGEKEIATLLLKNGADVNIKNRIQETPLDVAARRYQVEIAEILLEKGAVANRQSGSKSLSRLKQKVHKLKLRRYRLRLRQIKEQRKKSLPPTRLYYLG